jgi:hypothetical protein
MREKQLTELEGVSILTKSFFNKLIRRIECTKPLAGSGITITEKENGFEVSSGAAVVGGGSDFTSITLNVCSNGTPAEIVVLGKPVED